MIKNNLLIDNKCPSDVNIMTQFDVGSKGNSTIRSLPYFNITCRGNDIKSILAVELQIVVHHPVTVINGA